jgi:hypothetical protein
MGINGKEIIIQPTGRADEKLERDATKMAWGEVQSCANDYDEDGPDGDWESVPSVDVPEWAQDKEVMGAMINGEACRNGAQGGGKWFRFVHCEPPGMNVSGKVDGVVRGH